MTADSREGRERGLSTADLIHLATATRLKIIDAANDLAVLTAELRERVNQVRARNDEDDDDQQPREAIREVHVEHLHVAHLSTERQGDQ